MIFFDHFFFFHFFDCDKFTIFSSTESYLAKCTSSDDRYALVVIYWHFLTPILSIYFALKSSLSFCIICFFIDSCSSKGTFFESIFYWKYSHYYFFSLSWCFILKYLSEFYLRTFDVVFSSFDTFLNFLGLSLHFYFDNKCN